MNPIILAIVLAGIASAIWAGISGLIYSNPTSTAPNPEPYIFNIPVPFLKVIPKFPIDFNQIFNKQPIPNNSTSSIPSYDWLKFLKETPVTGILNYIGGGIDSIVTWISSPMQYLFTVFVHAMCPNCVLPPYFGILVTVLILLIFFYFGFETLMHLIGRIGIVALVVIASLVFLVVTLSVLGILH